MRFKDMPGGPDRGEILAAVLVRLPQRSGISVQIVAGGPDSSLKEY